MGSAITLAEAVPVEPSFLPEGWEIKVVGTADDLDAPAVGAQLISADERTGEVVAIVGITGIVDHVNDLIEPGAYADTLAKRRPKVCWAHSWEQPIGKVLRIEEWPPGDPRFAQVKATLNGQPWPDGAGALVASMRFNLKSERGREAFAAVDFYSETGECEWSIGWQTVPGATTRRKDGVRVCRKVELYEVSPVLFGAAPLTRTLQVKSLDLAAATRGADESKALFGRRRVEFDEDKHPRDRNGRFLEVGGQVRVWGTQKRGRIVARDGGSFTVRMYGSGEERRVPKGMLLANDDVLVTRMERVHTTDQSPSPVVVGWVDPNDAAAMAVAQSAPGAGVASYDEFRTPAARRADERGRRRHEQETAREVEAALAAAAEFARQATSPEAAAERERLRSASPANEAYLLWEQRNADELAAMAPAEARALRDEQWYSIMRGPLGDLQRERQAELGIKTLPVELTEPADDDVEVIDDDDDGIDYARLVAGRDSREGVYVTRFGEDGAPVSEAKTFDPPDDDAETAVEAADEDDEDENELHRLAADEIDWTEIEAAATGAPAEEKTAPADEPPAADGGVLVDVKAVRALLDGAATDFAALADNITVKAAGGGADRNRGNAEALRRSYESGKIAAKIRWGQPGDFDRCVKIAGKHMTPDQAKGYCNLRHKGATGVYPAQHKSAGVQAAELLAKSWNPLLEVGVNAAHTDRKHLGDSHLRGTFEQRREALDRALTEAIRPLHPGSGETADDGQPVPVGGDHGWVSIDGTWDDRVVATFIRYSSSGPDERQTYEVEYAWDGEEVTLLGDPIPVELQVSVVPLDSGGELTADAVEEAVFAPAVSALDQGIEAVKAAFTRAPEVKAGRVLSEANASRLRGALEHLLEVARAAGIELPGWTGEDKPDPARDADTPDTTAPGTGAVPRTGGEVKVLTVAEVQADLTSLGNFLL